jgi:cytochrome P450 PksS
VDELLDAAEARGGDIDLIADLALPLPVTVISEMMGVDVADRRNFNRWMSGTLDLDGGGLLDLLGDVPNLIQLNRFLKRLIRDRRRDRRDDLLGALIAAEEAGDRLTFNELVSTTFILLLAGHETTVNLIGNGMLALMEHRDQYERLRAQPELMTPAIEELLRFGNPVQINAPRFARVDMELAGVDIPRGAQVAPILASANRDETHFEEPDRLDIGRQQNKHVAFGFGVHYCVGAPLARLEGKAAFAAIVKRYPDIHLAVPPSSLEWRRSQSVRGLTKLPLHLR